MPQAVSRQPLNVDARIRSQVNAYEMGQVYLSLLPPMHRTYPFIRHHCKMLVRENVVK
jgi:hypothetical protein